MLMQATRKSDSESRDLSPPRRRAVKFYGDRGMKSRRRNRFHRRSKQSFCALCTRRISWIYFIVFWCALKSQSPLGGGSIKFIDAGQSCWLPRKARVRTRGGNRFPDPWMPGCSFAYFVCLLSECLRRVTDLRPPTSIPNPLPSGILPPAWSVLRALAQKSKFKAIFELGKINKKIASCDGTCVLFPSRRSGLSHNEIIARWLKSIYANLRVHRPLQRIGRGIRTRTRRRRL